jgi:hypothetical protein
MVLGNGRLDADRPNNPRVRGNPIDQRITTMLRTFTAAVIAASLMAGPVLAQGPSPAAGSNAPMTTSQPAKADATKSTAIKHVKKHHASKKHVAKALHHAKHVKQVKHVKRVKHPIQNTRG